MRTVLKYTLWSSCSCAKAMQQASRTRTATTAVLRMGTMPPGSRSPLIICIPARFSRRKGPRRRPSIPSGPDPQRGEHEGLDGVLAVFRLVPDTRAGPLDDLPGHFLALHRGQAVQED